jgi:multidrug efflux pump subunit AcrA (membrane-fusion protein)
MVDWRKLFPMRNIPPGRGLAAAGLVAVLLTGAACDRQESAARTSNAPGGGAPATPPPREVRVAAAVEERLPVTVAVTGTLAADEEIVVGFKVAGRVAELTVDLGSRVRRGQLLARLDPTDFRHRGAQAEAALRQARARLGLAPDGADDRVNPEETAIVREARAVLDEARLTRDRSERLWKDELIARSELDRAVAALQVAEGRYQAAVEEVRNRQALLAERRSDLALARQQLTDAELHSPIDGAVRERRASVGEYLAAGAPVVSVVRVHPLRLRVPVPERQAPGIRVGQRVRVQVEGDPAEHTGRVVRTSPVIVEQTRTLTIEAEVANPEGRLRPGAFAKAEIVVEGGRSVEKRVRTGRRAGDRVEILEGLRPGESVVVEPGNLTGGQPVAVAK